MLLCSAAEHIQRGEAELMLAGGAEAAIIPSGVGGFIACKALSKRNEDPSKASRPWDKNRDGFVMGEGAGECLSCRIAMSLLLFLNARLRLLINSKRQTSCGKGFRP